MMPPPVSDDAPAAAPDLPYRPGVGAALFNHQGLVWVGRRAAHSDPSVTRFWQMPQGGIDPGETPEQAVMRELMEETGTDKAEIIGETEDWLFYDLPEHLAGVSWGGKYRGQTQKWIALQFTGEDSDFDLDRHHEPEFTEWRWVPLDEISSLIVPFKHVLYRDIVQQFSHLPDRISPPA